MGLERSAAERFEDLAVMRHRKRVARAIKRIDAVHGAGAPDMARTGQQNGAATHERADLDDDRIVTERQADARNFFGVLVARPPRNRSRSFENVEQLVAHTVPSGGSVLRPSHVAPAPLIAQTR
jgi:hypothetical protein